MWLKAFPLIKKEPGLNRPDVDECSGTTTPSRMGQKVHPSKADYEN